MTKKIVVALGGNALIRNGDSTAEAQQRVADATARQLVPLILAGNQLVVVHGNGPQVGNIVLQQEAAEDEQVPSLPLDTCVAMSQGSIGYWLQQAFLDELRKFNSKTKVATVITQVLVDQNDEAFNSPSKTIGPFYKNENDIKKEASIKGFKYVEDAGRGYRRVVPSPAPIEIIETEIINGIVSSGNVVIAAGGGGVPVIMTESEGLKGVEAVIDKDLSAATLADKMNADVLVILTAVDNISINYKTAHEKALDKVSPKELDKYIEQNQFAPGSMLPKVEACINFVNKKDRTAVVGSLEKAKQVVELRSGTIITF